MKLYIRPKLGHVRVVELDARVCVVDDEGEDAREHRQHALGDARVGRGPGGCADANAVARARERFPRDLHRTDAERFEVRALTGAELVSALAKVGKTYKPLVSFIAETGARVSEALRVRYGDVDLRAGTWTVAGRLADNGTIRDAKTPGRMATVPLSKAAVELVKERRRKAMSCDGDRSNAAATLDVYARPPRQGDAARAERKALDA